MPCATFKAVAGGLEMAHGSNTLAIAARNTVDGPAGLIGQLTVEFTEGEPLVVPIDRRWKSAREAADGWQSPAFDDGSWTAPAEIAVSALRTPLESTPTGGGR